MKTLRWRGFFAGLWGIVFLGILVLWGQSYRGGSALALLKNHQYWGVSSYRGGAYWSWELGTSPDSRRWKARAWRPVEAPKNGDLDGTIWTTDDSLHEANYLLVSTAQWKLRWGLSPTMMYQWHGMLIAHSSGPVVIYGLGSAWTDIRVPYWMLAAVTGLLAAIAVMRWWRLRRWMVRVGWGLCQKCGYDLRASLERCPECGTAISRELQAKMGPGDRGPLLARMGAWVRRLDGRVRRNAGWLLACVMLGLILLVETRPGVQDRRVMATVVEPKIFLVRSPEVSTFGLSRLKLADGVEKLRKFAGMPLDIDWVAFGDPPLTEGTVLNQDMSTRENPMALTRLTELMLEDVVWQKYLDRICFYVTGNPRRLLVTTREALLKRFGTTVIVWLPNLVEPQSGLSDDEVRRDRGDQLCKIIRFEFADSARYAGAVETEHHGTKLVVRTLPEYQQHIAALLDAIGK